MSIEGTSVYCGDNCNHTGPHHYPPGVAEVERMAHRHQWVAVGSERNFGGGIGWVIQSCSCGEVRRAALPKDYPGEESQP
jgi:hypothetical protein